MGTNMTGKQIMQLFAIILVLIFFAWLTFYFLLVALAIGACVATYVCIRRFLEQKGIVKPSANHDVSPPLGMVEVIETEYRVVPDPETPKKPE